MGVDKHAIQKLYSTYAVLLTDRPNRAIPTGNEEKSERRKWLTDLCLEYVERFIFNTDEVTALVEQITELQKAHQQPYRCRQPGCDQTYVYHSGRVK